MSEAKFTPGPWFYGQSANQRNNHPGQRSIGLSLEEDGGVFGYRLHPNNDDGSYINISGYCSEADARLIAAAPELYEALREFVGAIDAGTTFADTSVIISARAALAKSSG